MLTNTTPIKSEGSLEGQKVGLTFDEHSLAHIMSVLTDLYSDPELAIIREYSTNALDSHIEAGNSDPILVTTPTGIFPFFVVQDFGIGMSVEDIETIYSKYGASTKRNTNAQTGMLGLGAKSALTYTGQFNLVCVKDGEKALVSVSRSDLGGTMEIVEVTPTNEPNGVKVTIPVKNSHTLIRKAEHFFKFWKDGLVLLDGKKPGHGDAKTIYDKEIRVELVPELNRDYVVMGNVAYEVENNLYHRYNLDRVAVYVPMGAVNFTPSREALHYTALTKKTLDKARKVIEDSIIKAATDDIELAKNYGEAAKSREHWENKLGRGLLRTVQYHGEDIPLTFEGWELSYNPSRYRNKVSTYIGSRSYSALERRTILVFDYPNKGLSKTQRQKIDEYCVRHSIAFNECLLAPPGKIKEKWLQNIPTVSWEAVVKEIKLIRKSQPKRIAPYEIWDEDTDTWEDVEELDGDLIYCNQPQKRNLHGWAIKEIQPYGTLVVLPKNRWPKFLRDYPAAVHIDEIIKERLEVAEKGITPEDSALIMGASSDSWLVERLIGVKDLLLDPEVLATLNSYSTLHKRAVEKYKRMNAWAGMLNKSPKSLPGKHMFENYPLLYSVHQHSYSNKETLRHIALYMNAVYNLERESK